MNREWRRSSLHHDRHEATEIDRPGLQVVHIPVEHAGEQGAARRRIDVLQLHRLPVVLHHAGQTAAQIDQVNVHGQGGVEAIRPAVQLRGQIADPKHFLIGQLVAETGEVMQGLAVLRSELRR